MSTGLLGGQITMLFRLVNYGNSYLEYNFFINVIFLAVSERMKTNSVLNSIAEFCLYSSQLTKLV